MVLSVVTVLQIAAGRKGAAAMSVSTGDARLFLGSLWLPCSVHVLSIMLHVFVSKARRKKGKRSCFTVFPGCRKCSQDWSS